MTRARLTTLLCIGLLPACGDDSGADGCETTGCESWEVCGNDGTCELGAGRCTDAADCLGADETCNLATHTCESALPTCNEGKTPSELVLDTDSCGTHTDCIDSSDCPANMRCENLAIDQESFNRACCVEGLRGCRDLGEACADEYDCASGLCLGRNDGPTYCSRQCEGPADCATPVTECYDMVVMMACVVPE